MNRVLDCGYILKLSGKEFEIKKLVGKGASSVTYLAEYNNTEHILKECNPLGINMHRNEKGYLTADTKLGEEKFIECLSRFKEGAEKQLLFRLTENLKNIISNIQDIYEANGTLYIDMTYFKGDTYDHVEDKNLYDLFRRMKALVQAVGHYHKLGFLYLDIKPQNIYTIPETPEMVMMFDFDSVTRLTDVGKVTVSGYTDVWAAPEQKLPKYRLQICNATDFFAIGEIIFYKLFGRHSRDEEHFCFSQYEYSPENSLFENVNPKVFSLITELFHKTLSCSVKKRYRSAAELMNAIDAIIKIADPKEPFIQNYLPPLRSFFVGRDVEMSAIHERLTSNNILFIKGIGGIGKSELAKQYANKYSKFYSSIVFIPYLDKISTLLQDDDVLVINNFSPFPGENSETYASRKLRKLKELCDDRTLLIIDNYDNVAGDDLNVLFELGCKVIVTTRIDYQEFGQQLSLEKIKDHTFIRELFDNNYTRLVSANENSCIDEIIALVNGHTMSVELIAKQMAAGRIMPSHMLKALQEKGISASGKEKVFVTKDGEFFSKSTYNCIQALFDVSNLSETALYILTNLVFVPFTGIPTSLFYDWCGLVSYDDINLLIREGWIQHEDQTDFICLHPVICDAIIEQHLFTGQPYVIFLHNMYNYIEQWENVKMLEEYKLSLTLFKGMLSQINKYASNTITIAEHLLKCVNKLRFHMNSSLEKACYMKALTITKQLHGEHSESTGELYYYLARWNYNQGYYKEAEEDCRRAIKTEKPFNKSTILLGSILRARGKNQAAEDTFLSLLHHFEEIGEKGIRAYYRILVLLGDLYLGMERYDDAEKLMLQYLNYQLHQGTERGKIAAYYTLAVLKQKKKEFSDSIIYSEQALSLAQKVYGETLHLNNASIYSVLGRAYMGERNFAAAHKYLQKALDVRLTQLGRNHPETAKSYNSMGVLFELQEDYINARNCYQNVLNIGIALYGSEDIEVSKIKQSLDRVMSKCPDDI